MNHNDHKYEAEARLRGALSELVVLQSSIVQALAYTKMCGTDEQADLAASNLQNVTLMCEMQAISIQEWLTSARKQAGRANDEWKKVRGKVDD